MNENLRLVFTAQNQTKPAFDQVEKSLKDTANEAQRTKQRVMGTTGALGDMGRKAGMAGIQIQQFVGQVTNGTSATTALSMQAADLGFVLGFPLLGAVVGITSAIAGPMIAALFGAEESITKVQERAKSATENIEEFTESIRGLSMIQYQRELSDVALEIEKVDAKIASLRSKRSGYMYRMDDYNTEMTNLEAERINLKVLQGEYNKAYKAISGKAAESQDKVKTDSWSSASYQMEMQTQMTTAFQNELDARADAADAAKREQLAIQDSMTAAYLGQLEFRKKAEEEMMQYQLDMQSNMSDAYLEQQQANQKEYEKMLEASKKFLKPLEDGLVNLISGTKSAKESFADMARSIIADLIRMQMQRSIIEPLAGKMSAQGGIMSIFDSMFSFSGGGYTGSGARSGGVDGQGGFPAILHPNETVIDHTKGGGSGVTINQVINVTTGVQQTVRTEIAQLMPKIAEASKAAVLDARKRGGSYSAAFGG